MSSIIREPQDFEYLSWTKIRGSSGTAGSFLKAYSEIGGKTYYKLSNYDGISGVVGHECVNEIIVDRLLSLYNIEHLSYELLNANIIVDGKKINTWLCRSKDFKQRGESKIALDVYYQLEKKENETPLQFCVNRGWGEYVYNMLAVDFIICNRDRHGANIEILFNRKKRSIGPAPLFDHGVSLAFNCNTLEEISKFDVTKDYPVQCFVGGKSAFDNLNLIPRGCEPGLKAMADTDRKDIIGGLDGVIPEQLQDKIWQMIKERSKIYEDFCNKR